MQDRTDILALLRTWDSPIDPDNIREAAASEIERLRARVAALEAALEEERENASLDIKDAADRE